MLEPAESYHVPLPRFELGPPAFEAGPLPIGVEGRLARPGLHRLWGRERIATSAPDYLPFKRARRRSRTATAKTGGLQPLELANAQSARDRRPGFSGAKPGVPPASNLIQFETVLATIPARDSNPPLRGSEPRVLPLDEPGVVKESREK